MRTDRRTLFSGLSLFIALVLLALLPGVTADEGAEAIQSTPEVDATALERARNHVRMIDDIYKGGIVLITTHYVDGTEDLPAGSAFKKLFEAASNKGWHDVRLLDGTGEPINEENAPNDEFERAAVAALVAGDEWVERIVNKDGSPHLRVATPIPVVMEKCTMCHDAFLEVEAGKAIGAMGYTVPIE